MTLTIARSAPTRSYFRAFCTNVQEEKVSAGDRVLVGAMGVKFIEGTQCHIVDASPFLNIYISSCLDRANPTTHNLNTYDCLLFYSSYFLPSLATNNVTSAPSTLKTAADRLVVLFTLCRCSRGLLRS